MTNQLKRPMRAISCEPTLEALETLRYPGYSDVKEDGVRGLAINGKLLSRKLIELPNKYLQSFDWSLINGYEGELLVGNTYRETTSAVMSEDGEPELSLVLFDNFSSPKAFKDRREELSEIVDKYGDRLPIKKVDQIVVDQPSDLLNFFTESTRAGKEGAIYRFENSFYKQGKSTLNGSELIRLKPFEDRDAIILGLIQGKTNLNTLEKDNLGYAKRSSAKDGKVFIDEITVMRVKDYHSGVEFNVSSGITSLLGKQMYQNPKKYLGRIIKYRSMAYGDYDKPRHPVFLEFRHENDVI